MKQIDDEILSYIQRLSMLELSEEEARQARLDLQQMIAYLDKLNELDTTDVEPMSHVFLLGNVFRDDVVTNQDGRTDTLANAPKQREGGFYVPRTIDGEGTQ
ncbi:MAG: Asp-tRNA(Asn)/Glu-tRNA(Gln) amidotransferase subunit GatC [Clostridiales bacterium]|nr:Asp-tRNA(Asn)/Glu-tRNA(Gln) amidotransferase subunit GatC [Clostridiales bacterium]